MSKRAMLFWLLMLAAVAVGVPMVNRSLLGETLPFSIRNFSSLMESMGILMPWAGGNTNSIKRGRNYYPGFTIEEASAKRENNRILSLRNMSREEALAHARANPERPWRVWYWDFTNPVGWRIGMRSYFGARRVNPPAWDTEEMRQFLDEDMERIDFLRACDPDNGLALAYLAACHARIGAPYRKQDETDELVVTDQEALVRAAELLRQAVSKKKFTQYAEDAAREMVAVRSDAETLDEALPYTFSTSAGIPDVDSASIRDLVSRLLVEAKRRLGGGDVASGPGAAFDILCDLQTMGARIAANGTKLLDIAPGVRIVKEATDEGVAMLEAAGDEEFSRRLFERGLIFVRPFLSEWDLDLSASKVWEKVPGVRGQRMRPPRFSTDFLMSFGFILAISTPNLTMTVPYGETLFSPDEFRTSIDFEHWALEKGVTNQLYGWVWIVFLVLLCLHAAVTVLARRGGAHDSGAWPAVGQIVSASVLFAGLAVAPGVIVAAIGYELDGRAFQNWDWLFFWNIWGVVAAFASLWLLSGRAGRREDAGAVQPRLSRFLPRGLKEWAAVGALIASVLGMTWVYTTNERNYHDIWSGSAPLIAAVVFFGFILLVAVRVFSRTMFLFTRREPPTLSGRIFLAGLAGGLLLWFAAYFAIERHERSWGRRDTLIISRKDDKTLSFNPIEARLVNEVRTHMRKALAEVNPEFSEGRP